MHGRHTGKTNSQNTAEGKPENAVRCMCLRTALRHLMQHAAMAGAPHCII